MTPDDLRAAADRIADVYTIQDADAATWRALVHVVDAARRLADVIEETTNHPEPECEKHPDGDVFKCGWKQAYTGVFNIATGKDQT